jgi:hypothetical protein
MPYDFVLCGLIDQSRLARETYFIRKQQELSPRQQGLTALDQHELTKTAEAAWKTAEAAIWRHWACAKSTQPGA